LKSFKLNYFPKLLSKILAGVFDTSVTVKHSFNSRERISFSYDPVFRTIWLIVKKDKTYSLEIHRSNIEALKVLIAKVYPGDVELKMVIPGKCEKSKYGNKAFELSEVELVFEVKEKPTPQGPLVYDVGSKS